MVNRAVFLDRDGVINRYVLNPEFGTFDSPARPEDFDLLPGVGEAIAILNETEFLTIVVSNQPGIAKGRFTPALLDSVTDKMQSLIRQSGGRLDAVYYCPHHPAGIVEEYRERCDCRKPKHGMLQKAARELNVDLSTSYVIGDGVHDVIAGQEAGTRTIFVSPRKCYVCSELSDRKVLPDWTAGSLPEAVRLIQKLEAGHHFIPAASQPKSSCIWEGDSMNYAAQYLQEAIDILKRIDSESIEKIANLLVDLHERGGRLFFLGVGGGAGHASHAVCDFRKICQIEAYTPSDNVSELTARVNDDGWDSAYANWLRGSRINNRDAVFVFSVGGGDLKRNISSNLVRALEYAKSIGAKVCGVVGRDGGFTAQVADACVIVPIVNSASITPHTEAFQALVWHLLVSHPRLKASEMKWESSR